MFPENLVAQETAFSFEVIVSPSYLKPEQLLSYEAAIAFYDATLQTQPDGHAWAGRAFALLKLGRYAAAIDSYDQALQLRADETSWCNRGEALYYQGQCQEALSSYDRALEMEPDFEAAWYGKACVQLLLGEVEQALENLQQAIDLSPDEYRTLARTDPRLAPLHLYPQFHRLLESP